VANSAEMGENTHAQTIQSGFDGAFESLKAPEVKKEILPEMITRRNRMVEELRFLHKVQNNHLLSGNEEIEEFD
jgi:hypothetical protein